MIDERGLRSWLAAHRAAWVGWPTTRCLEDHQERRRRFERLRRAGCPYVRSPWVVDTVEHLVAELRMLHRQHYCQRVREPDDEIPS